MLYNLCLLVRLVIPPLRRRRRLWHQNAEKPKTLPRTSDTKCEMSEPRAPIGSGGLTGGRRGEGVALSVVGMGGRSRREHKGTRTREATEEGGQRIVGRKIWPFFCFDNNFELLCC